MDSVYKYYTYDQEVVTIMRNRFIPLVEGMDSIVFSSFLVPVVPFTSVISMLDDPTPDPEPSLGPYPGDNPTLPDHPENPPGGPVGPG